MTEIILLDDNKDFGHWSESAEKYQAKTFPWRKYLNKIKGKKLNYDHKVKEYGHMLAETHHHAYGQPWALGKLQFLALKEFGLQPEHSFLDVGCGSMRTGIWVIKYLDKGNYFGTESDYNSLKLGAEYEIPLNDLEEKEPSLILDSNFRLEKIGRQFDFICAFSVLVHLTEDLNRLALQKISQVLKPGGKLVLAGRVTASEEDLENKYHLFLKESIRKPGIFGGSSQLFTIFEKRVN